MTAAPATDPVRQLEDDLLRYIGEAIDAHPRSLQVRIGPSEIGQKCARKLAYKLLNAPVVNPGEPSWKPAVGTAVHSWLEQAMADPRTDGRFLLEQEVTVGQIGGIDITGHCDAYDMLTNTVLDWKIVGPTPLKTYRAKGPGPQYRTQAHLYGRGWVHAGATPATVMICFLPRNGELRDAFIWSEPYDEQVAVDGLARLEALHNLTAVGPVVLPMIPVSEDYCTSCDWYRPGSTDPTVACPGDPNRAVRSSTPAIGLVP